MKKILSLVLLACMLFTLTSCTLKKSGANPPDTDDPSVSDEAEELTNSTKPTRPSKSDNSRQNPAGANETVVYNSMREDYEAYELEITLLEVRRGGGALKKLVEADTYCEIPAEGKEYLLAKFKVAALQSKNDELIEIGHLFEIVKSDGGTYNDSYAYAYGLEELTTMYQGSTQEGYVCFIIDKNDMNPLIVFPSYGNSQFWFSGAKTAGSKDDNYNPLGDPNKLGSENNPAKINETANFNSIDIPSEYYEFNVDVTVTEILRGQKALEVVMAAHEYNDIPPVGKEYLLAKVKIEAIASRNGSEIDIGNYDFGLVNANGVEYKEKAYVSGLDDLGFELMYPGTTKEGYLTFYVDVNDTNPYMLALIFSDIPVWFSFPQSKGDQQTQTKTTGQRNGKVEAWALGCSAILAVKNGFDPYEFGMFSRSEANASIARLTLSGSWDCNNRNDLINLITRMTERGHSDSFATSYEYALILSEKEFQDMMEKLGDEEDMELAIYMVSLTKSLGDKWGDKNIKAWDWFRMIHLAGWGYIAGYLELQEAYDYMLPVIERLNSTFSSWDEAVDNYMDGYAWWSQTDVSEPGTEYKHRLDIYQEYKSDKKLFDPTVWGKQ